jgi:hypothetical protein
MFSDQFPSAISVRFSSAPTLYVTYGIIRRGVAIPGKFLEMLPLLNKKYLIIKRFLVNRNPILRNSL